MIAHGAADRQGDDQTNNEKDNIEQAKGSVWRSGQIIGAENQFPQNEILQQSNALDVVICEKAHFYPETLSFVNAKTRDWGARDAPDAIVMSFDHYTSLIDTVYLLSSPANAALLAKSIEQMKSGLARRRALIDLVELK
jgi:hypothetical protein